MRKIAVLGAIFLGLGGTAQAHTLNASGRSLLRARSLASVSVAACPAGVPVQPITVINQARVSPFALARVENALVAQSLQLHAAWGTSCVQFGPAGWPLYLTPGASGWALHYAPDLAPTDNTACGTRPDITVPCALVSVGHNWTINVSHEVLEMLADPDNQGNEICDPVEDGTYQVRGVWVSDFVTPAWFLRGNGPYDHMRLVHRAGATA